MSIFAHVDGIGVLVEQCVADTVLQYRRDNHPGQKTVDTLAEHLRSVEATVSVRPAGVAMIHVTCEGMNTWQRHIEFFRAQRKRGGEWVITASSLAER